MLTGKGIVGSKQTFILQKVSVPEWNYDGADAVDAHVYVRTLGADQARAVRDLSVRQEAARGTSEEDAVSMAGWCVLGVCDEHGALLFTVDDIPALQARSLMALQRCSNAVLALNPLTQDDAEAKGTKEDASDDAPKAG